MSTPSVYNLLAQAKRDNPDASEIELADRDIHITMNIQRNEETKKQTLWKVAFSYYSRDVLQNKQIEKILSLPHPHADWISLAETEYKQNRKIVTKYIESVSSISYQYLAERYNLCSLQDKKPETLLLDDELDKNIFIPKHGWKVLTCTARNANETTANLGETIYSTTFYSDGFVFSIWKLPQLQNKKEDITALHERMKFPPEIRAWDLKRIEEGLEKIIGFNLGTQTYFTRLIR